MSPVLKNALQQFVQIMAGALLCTSTLPGAATEWAPVFPLNSNATYDNSHDITPQIATDGAGNWICAWASDNPMSNAGNDKDILFSRSTDNGASWSAAAVLNSNAADNGAYSHPRITPAGGGVWLVAWHGDPPSGGSDSEIMYARTTDNGLTWSAASALNTDFEGDTRMITTSTSPPTRQAIG